MRSDAIPRQLAALLAALRRTAAAHPIALAVAAAIILVATLPLWVSAYVLGLLTTAYYFGVFAMSWDLLFGFAGEVNFGPTFLIGLGAYTAGILDNLYGWSIPACAAAGTGAAIVGGVLLALPALRLRGPYFGLVTLVAVLLLQQAIVIFAGVTGGEIGLTVPDVTFVDAGANYLFAFAFLLLSGAILFGLSRSSLGLILQASGQDAVAASALGFNVAKHKLAAFCVSALFSGLAGALLVFYQGTASVGTVVDIALGVQIIIAAVLGGRRTILGGALGAVFLIVAGEALRPLGQLNTFVVAAIALAVILFFPDGFLGGLLRRRSGG
jgi:branched-chain amino acid transport system permease protein